MTFFSEARSEGNSNATRSKIRMSNMVRPAQARPLACQALKLVLDIRVHRGLHGRIIPARAHAIAVAICRKRLDRSHRHVVLNLTQTLSSLLACLHPRREFFDIVALRRHMLTPMLHSAMTSGYVIEAQFCHGIDGLRPFL